jgi:CPA2 family monovalent cation:H+ antiporter-2
VVAGYFFKEQSRTEDFESLAVMRDHVIVCGYGVVGKFVVKALFDADVQYIIVDNSYKHVQEALKEGERAYYGDMSKTAILEKLHTKEAASIIVTLEKSTKKRLVCESILSFAPHAKVVVKVINWEEKRDLRGLNIHIPVDGEQENALKLVAEALVCVRKEDEM